MPAAAAVALGARGFPVASGVGLWRAPGDSVLEGERGPCLQEDEPVKAYQATFDTPKGDWVTIRVPWHEFVPVKMAQYNPEAGPLDPSKISSLGLVYSRFDLNNISNSNHAPGALQLCH
jgi:hypothetical protein